MLHAGKRVERYTGTVHIWRALEGFDPELEDADNRLEDLQIVVTQIPPGWEREAYKLFPEPDPPLRTDKKVKNQQTGELEPAKNENDPAYLEELSRNRQLRQAKRIHDATIDPLITWETDVALREKDPRAFYAGIAAELAESFGMGEVGQWDLVIVGISSVGGVDVRLAEESFFRVAPRHVVLQGEAQGGQDGQLLAAVPRPPDLQGVGKVAE